jgi:hypothetical protein
MSDETNCQVIGFVCPSADLCTNCHGTGNEPVKEEGTDLCASCDHCFDEQSGWSTGVEPNTDSTIAVRKLVSERGNP